MVWKFFTCDDVVGGHRCTESNCHSAQATSPANQPWVGWFARKAPAFSHSRTESNKTPTATPKPTLAQGAKRVEQNKSFGLAFSKASRRRPPVKSILFEVSKAVVFDEDVCGIEFCGCFFEVFCEVFVGFIGYAVTDSEGVAFFLDVYVIVVFCH